MTTRMVVAEHPRIPYHQRQAHRPRLTIRNRAGSEPNACCHDNQPCDVGVRLHPQPMTTGRSA